MKGREEGRKSLVIWGGRGKVPAWKVRKKKGDAASFHFGRQRGGGGKGGSKELKSNSLQGGEGGSRFSPGGGKGEGWASVVGSHRRGGRVILSGRKKKKERGGAPVAHVDGREKKRRRRSCFPTERCVCHAIGEKIPGGGGWGGGGGGGARGGGGDCQESFIFFSEGGETSCRRCV